jgi:hypothetical protein
MKYLIHVTAPIVTSIDADNLRGEPRYERNIFAAAIASGRDVHTTTPVWRSSSTPPKNLHDGLNKDWQEDSLLITYGVTGNPHITAKAKNYMVHYLDGPNDSTKDDFLKYHRESPGCIVAVCNYKAWNWFTELQRVLGEDKVEWVQGPIVPYVVENADNFNKQYLTWSYRNFWALAQNEPDNMVSLFRQVALYLKNNSKLRVAIIVGLWDIWENTKAIISPAEPLGYPPYEAAMFGIPTILRKDTHPFQDGSGGVLFPEILTAPSSSLINTTFLSTLDKIVKDSSFYKKYGNAYRTHVNNTATYAAYIKQLDAIVAKRGW